jgi:hypothetical protein
MKPGEELRRWAATSAVTLLAIAAFCCIVAAPVAGPAYQFASSGEGK